MTPDADEDELNAYIRPKVLQKHYLGTFPGILRILEFVLAAGIVIIFSGIATHKVPERTVVPLHAPYFDMLCMEMFFFMSSIMSTCGNFHIILTTICNRKLTYVFFASFYFIIYDSSSFLCISIGSIYSLSTYRNIKAVNSTAVDKAMLLRGYVDLKEFACVLGICACAAHLISAVMDFVLFLHMNEVKSHNIRLYDLGVPENVIPKDSVVPKT